MTPVKQYSITDLTTVAHPSSKDLQLSFSSLSAPLNFHCGNKDEALAILVKLESSKAAAGEALETIAADHAGASSGGEEAYEPSAPAAEPKAVRFAAPASSPNGIQSATVLYDFDAQGDDELTVKENEMVTIVDKENDEWWLVRNSAGQEGVVPAQYVQLDDGSAPEQAAEGAEEDDEEEERTREAEAAAALEAQRQREREEKAAQRMAIEQAARDKERQEEEDRKLALQLEHKEREKQERRARRNEEEARQRREIEVEQR
jgi:hypothetical protein